MREMEMLFIFAFWNICQMLMLKANPLPCGMLVIDLKNKDQLILHKGSRRFSWLAEIIEPCAGDDHFGKELHPARLSAEPQTSHFVATTYVATRLDKWLVGKRA